MILQNKIGIIFFWNAISIIINARIIIVLASRAISEVNICHILSSWSSRIQDILVITLRNAISWIGGSCNRRRIRQIVVVNINHP